MLLTRNFPKLILILISFGIVILVTDFLTQKYLFSNQVETVALSNAVKRSQEREGMLLTFFERSANTLNAIRQSNSFKQFFIGQPSSKQAVEGMMLAIARSQNDIMKARYIDENGREVVRIERENLGRPAQVVNDAQLQEKDHRYFFYESINRPANQIWFSDIDLNMEHGAIEQPYKPTFRAVLPLNIDGQFKGILIINYFMQPLLDTFANTSLYHIILADIAGETLIHYDSARNWSRFSGGEKLKKDFAEWDAITQKTEYKSQRFFARHLDLPMEQKLILIMSLNSEYLAYQETLFSRGLVYATGVTLLITALFGLVFAQILNKFFVNYETQSEYIEALTGLNNQIHSLLEKNSLYMEMASDGIHILNQQGDVVVCSQAFADMLGYSREEALKLNVRDWEVQLGPDDIDMAMKSFTEEPKSFETQHRRKDGVIIDVEVNVKWFKAGDGDLFYASSRDITQRKAMEIELHRLATTDFLTELPTRRIFFEQLGIELERYHRYRHPVSVVMLDLDHFKTINDSYGHGVGDEVLKQLAQVLFQEIRKVDIAARIGGEEFALILTGADKDKAMVCLERIQSRIAQSHVAVGNKRVTYTISLGITEVHDQDSDVDQIVERADKALYQAKRLGRNRVEVDQSERIS
ncbi:diguanylate cyclase [Vibrio sp. AK197]